MSALIPIDDRFERLVEALEDPAERSTLESVLPGYLRAQRWFGGAARDISNATVTAWADLGLEEDAALCIVHATDGEGYETTHQLYLGIVDDDSGPPAIFDALERPAVRDLLARVVLEGMRVTGHDVALVGEAAQGVEPVWLTGESSQLDGEQTNTTLLYEDTCMAKVYRRLRPGINPDVEVLGALTDAGFEAVPQYLGRALVTGPDSYQAEGILVERYVHNEGSAWDWALRNARAEMAASTSPEDLVSHIQADALDQRSADLGALTARLHVTLGGLSDAAFAPVDVEAAMVEELVRGVRDDVAATAEMAHHSSYTAHGLETALERLSGLQAQPSAVGGRLIRVHGDYHLGQVLVDGTAFVIIDFEGEPARPLDERRARQYPLVDVAGMLRSFDYAARTAVHDTEADEALAPAWAGAMRGAFLAAYWEESDAGDPALQPSTREGREWLLALLELRKALYELRYELQYRPGWADIPAAAIPSLAERL